MRHGAERSREETLTLLRAIGCSVERNKLSRIDPYVDMPKIKVHTLYDPYAAGHYVTRTCACNSYEIEDYIIAADMCVHSFHRVSNRPHQAAIV